MRFAIGRHVRSALILAFALSATKTPAAPPEAPTYTLRYKFERGATVYFTVHNEIVRRFEQQGLEVQTKDGNDTLKHFKVRSIDGKGQAILELMIDRTRMFAEQKDFTITYDSASGDPPPDAFGGVHETIGRPWLFVTVNDRGETIEAQTPEGQKAAEAFESPDLISRVLPVLPEQPVAVGARWKESYQVLVSETEQLKKPVKMQRTYQLSNVEGDLATIEVSTQRITADVTPRQESFLAQGMYSGSLTLDMTRGLLLSRDLHVNQSVIGYDGPGTAMSIILNQKDAYAPEGAKTAFPAARTARADESAAEK